MGVANGLHYPIEAARILRDRGNDRVVIVLHGNGGQRAELDRAAKNHGLSNVIFSDPVPDKSVVAQLVAACDACMTIYQARRERTWSPNKLFDSLAAGRPVLVNVPGWLTEIVQGNDCGRGVSPARPEELADVLEQWACQPERCRQMGRNARSLAEQQFARGKLAECLESVLQCAVDGGTNAVFSGEK